jgi:hypothetical protein
MLGETAPVVSVDASLNAISSLKGNPISTIFLGSITPLFMFLIIAPVYLLLIIVRLLLVVRIALLDLAFLIALTSALLRRGARAA